MTQTSKRTRGQSDGRRLTDIQTDRHSNEDIEIYKDRKGQTNKQSDTDIKQMQVEGNGCDRK